MAQLPNSVEAYLVEGGFNPTEILVLRRLLEGSAMTLREIAAKTGKSTGVLDQAIRKLIIKGVVSKETINDKSKYTVGSLEAIQSWMKEDMKAKHKELNRKESDFESFISTLKLNQARPEMEYFEGEEGITKAYGKLLTLAEKELLFYVPVNCKEEDDPLRDFRVQYFRARHKRELFSRVLVPDTMLGKRYQSRDPFEYRKTVLMPEAQFPVSFEKVIAEEVVACFNHVEKRACFLRYTELAQSERSMFGMMWERGEEDKGNDKEEDEKIALGTVTMSAVRDFFISRKSVAAFAACAVLAAAVTFGLYRQNVYLNTQRVRERVLAIAVTAAPEFDAMDLDQLRTWRDAEKPVYEKVVKKLQEIKERNDGVEYVYIMRTKEDPYFVEYVSDSESLDIRSSEDLSNDDLRNDMIAPGHSHYDGDYESGVSFLLEAMEHPTVDKKPYTDIWGTWISAYVPIHDKDGVAVAALCVDIAAESIKDLSKETFQLIYYFLGFFLLFIFIRLAAFNRSLCKELLKLIDTKEVMILLGSSALLALLITFGTYKYTYNLNLQRVRERVMAIAATAALEFDEKDIDQLHTKEDVKKPEFMKLVEHLRQIKMHNENIRFVYIDRPIGLPDASWEVVADADYGTPDEDFNGNGIIEDFEQLTMPGQVYPHLDPLAQERLLKPTANFLMDEWGEYCDASAPIFDSEGNVVAALFVNIDVSEVVRLTRESFRFVLFFFGLFIIFVLVGLAVYSKNLRSDLLKLINAKAVLVTLGVCSLIALGVTYGMYRYTLNIMKDEVGQRLMSIAATAAPEIDAKDLDVLRIAEDMKREEYQRVFKQLNEIRDRNENEKIIWIYILRPTEDKNIWEWVVDADSNYNIPNSGVDYNDDGVIDDADEGVSPGVMYDATGMRFTSVGLNGPMIEDFGTDQWGTFLTGFAPIRDEDGQAVAVLGIDIEVSDFYGLVKLRFSNYFWFFSMFFFLILIRFGFMMNSVYKVRPKAPAAKFIK
ncbi:hypothetical protein KKF55_00350 [Patescibacteria group bacterium]|nr:hypothetical protein [Patescibacteria group bacterium]